MKREKKPVLVMYDSGVDQLEQKAIEKAMEEIMDYFPGRGFVLSGLEVWDDGGFCARTDQILSDAEHIATDRGSIVVGNSLLGVISHSKWYKRNHYIVILIVSEKFADTDIAPSLRWGSICVQSVADFRDFPRKERILAIKGLFQHELGHILGLAQNLDRPKTEYREGIHCTHLGCIMQYFGSIEELVEISRESEHTGRYCALCAREARESEL
ncbi:hypothetical protein IKF92_02875 [Candidatus Saccharibacteria bacterium]|nr:hypothetical protein [Candidatus Saccharibacteria bacterium]